MGARWPSSPGSSPGEGHCVVFLGKTLDSPSAFLHPGVKMGKGELLGKPNKLGEGGGVTCDGLASRPGGLEILLAASCYGQPDKLRYLSSYQLIGSKAPRLQTKLLSQIFRGRRNSA